MKTIKTPVLPGDILEFKLGRTLVRVEVWFVHVAKEGVEIVAYADDIYTKNCKKCYEGIDQKRCEFWDKEAKDCGRWDIVRTKLDEMGIDIEQIDPAEIGKKYKIVRKSYNPRAMEKYRNENT